MCLGLRRLARAQAAQAVVWVVLGLSLCKRPGQKPCPFLIRLLKWLFQGEDSAWARARTHIRALPRALSTSEDLREPHSVPLVSWGGGGRVSIFLMEKGMSTHFSILAWRIPWTEEPGGLQSMWSLRVRHD